jgi:hypothetical protein
LQHVERAVILHAIEDYSRRSFIVKKLLNLILGIAVLATLGSLATAKAGAKIKSTTSNASYREASDKATPTPSPTPKKPVAKIKSTKSNASYRAAGDQATATPTPKPNATVKIKSTKSNASDRVAVDNPSPTPKANVRVLNRKQEVLYRDKAIPTPTPTPKAKEKRLKQLDARPQ